jgi:hypothetical protein
MTRVFGVLAVLLAVSMALAGMALASPATDILGRRPLAPTDRTLFSPAVYPETPPLVPAPGAEPTEAQVLALLDGYLRAEFPGNSQAQVEALTLFNDPVVRQRISSPSLRAALVTLKGTIGEPAILFIRNALTPFGAPKVATIKFDDQGLITAGDPAVARTFVNPNSQQMFIVFNAKYRAENPFLQTQTVGHEALHQDNAVADFEEVGILALHVVIYLQQLVRHPELAHTGTELSRRITSNALARFNSGVGFRLGLYASNSGAPILPGSSVGFRSWWEQFENLPNFVPTPGNELLGEVLAKLHEEGRPVCSPTEFNRALLDCIDQNQGVLSPEELVAVSVALGLDTGPAPTLLVYLDRESHFQAGKTMSLRAVLTPGSAAPSLVDAYVVVQVSGGSVFSLQAGGGGVSGVAPIARHVIPIRFSGEIFRFSLTGAEPVGSYAWYAALTQADTLNVVGAVDDAPFSIP